MNIERLDDYDFGTRGGRRGSKWDPYLDGATYRVSASEAGHKNANALRSALVSVATRRNKRIQTRVEGTDVLVFRAIDKATA